MKLAEKENPLLKKEDSLNAAFLKTRNILLTGEINKEMTERVVRQLLLMDENDPDQPIKLLIDSPGGDADAGYAMFDMIRFISAPVYTLGIGLVASAGALVLLAAPIERRLALPNSHYMIHQPLSGIRGVATTIEIHAREVEKLRARINQHIAEATGRDVETVAKDTDRDFWLGAEEAREYGLVSKVLRKNSELERELSAHRK